MLDFSCCHAQSFDGLNLFVWGIGFSQREILILKPYVYFLFFCVCWFPLYFCVSLLWGIIISLFLLAFFLFILGFRLSPSHHIWNAYWYFIFFRNYAFWEWILRTQPTSNRRYSNKYNLWHQRWGSIFSRKTSLFLSKLLKIYVYHFANSFGDIHVGLCLTCPKYGN